MKKNVIIKNLLPKDKFFKLSEAVKDVLNKGVYYNELSIGRKTFKTDVCPYMNVILHDLLPIARETFGSETIIPSYAFFSEYYSPDSFLPRHKDNGGNSYNIDLCLYCDKDWPIFVEGEEFKFGVNEAVTVLGEEQFHWRERLGENNVVGNVFFFYTEPEHPFFTDPNFDKS
jgi:hypothetical protein